MNGSEFTLRSPLDHTAKAVFDWHMRPGALERLIPPWENVKIEKRTGTPTDGGRIRFKLSRGPTDLTWELRHTGYEEGKRFSDEQTEGPFARWVHTHRFESLGGKRCTVEDYVNWELPMGVAGKLLGNSTVEHELERLFTFRHHRIANELARIDRYGGLKSLRIGVTGSSGLIGRALCHTLTTGNHEVVRVVRKRGPIGSDVFWDPTEEKIDADGLEGLDAVVHLAGESLLGFRWTDSKKKRITESRVRGTEFLARTLAALRHPPRVLVSASAVGFYGDRGTEILTERSKAGKGFLADLCQAWEAASRPASRMGIRVVNLRTGLVLTPLGGALGTMLLPFRAGVGGRLGSGRQYMSWIDHDDLLTLIHHVIRTDSISGAVNATSPYAVPNSTFTDTLGRVLHRPTLLPIPHLAVRALLGEMGRETLLSSTRTQPGVALETGFEFRYPGLEDSLLYQLGREVSSPG